MPQQPVLIVGAGISGLSIAYELQKLQVPYVIMEASDRSGGVLKSLHIDGFELDAGPNSIAASPEMLHYLEELGLGDKILVASAASKNRFLVRNKQLHAVSPHPFKIIGSKYLSGASKWKLFTERFRKSAPVKEEESVSEFIGRRFNTEIAEYVFDPVLSGIYAGNPDKLSIAEVLPMLPKWERTYGSITKGLMKEKGALGGRKIVSLSGGNAMLTSALAARLVVPVRLNCAVSSITSAEGKYHITFIENGQQAQMEASQVILTTPSYTTAAMLQGLDASLAARLLQLEYPEMGVLHVGYNAAAVAHPVDGFGFLVPNAERLHFLGAICNAAIFPTKAPQGKLLLTVFTGGARLQHLLRDTSHAVLQQNILAELSTILGISEAPVMQHFEVWKHAIPQLNVGHAGLRELVKQFEAAHAGIHIAGNYLHGVAVPALVQYAATLATTIAKN
ncbi:oxygen-dependent protoporphyrinogen oxidase [Chitinophaga jiangningensis]|uniref:Coproporphyrinogen III oxidase n=1 Tax=Chitinophaga jiangningensis TaxID=1419482 RepID=A0A1M7MFK0_9BACT|nr:protoporphyrinogen oxidase [Chitinophaga jiangningensis]SHM89624.1 oxygen-dependent protoporphyrinogen oxidase [Chitinophaga jiangningensis]